MPLLEWSVRYLPALREKPPSKFHVEFCEDLDALAPGEKLNVMAPRGAAKSSYASLAFPLREILEGRENFIVILSDTTGQAKDFMRAIRREIESNEAIKADYRYSCVPGALWREDRISLVNGCEIAAMGTGAKIRGRKSAENKRPTLVIGDDLQNKDHIVSALQRERSWEWLTKDVLSAGDSATRFVVVGTALHREAIVCRLANTPGWRTKTFKSIIVWPKNLHLWDEWQKILYDRRGAGSEAAARAFFEANRAAMEE